MNNSVLSLTIRFLFVVFVALIVLVFGGVHGVTRVVLHGVLLLIGVGLLISPDSRRVPNGFGKWVIAGAGMFGLMGVGLLPMGDGYLSISMPDTVGALSVWTLLAGFALCFGLWVREQYAPYLESAAVGLSLLVGVIALGHVIVGSEGLLGVLKPLKHTPLFVPPMINANHTATLSVFLLPVLAFMSPAGPILKRLRQLSLFLLVLVWGYFCESVGGVLALSGVLLWWLVSSRPIWQRILVLGGAASGVGVAIWQFTEFTRTGWEVGSFARRIIQWRDLWDLLWENPAWGSGAGTFSKAYAPYASYGGGTWSHAHSEPLQWAVELGWIVLPLGIGFFVWFVRLEGRLTGMVRGLWYGVLGVLLHSLVDFPLHVPGIALLVLGALVLMASEVSRSVNSSSSRLGWLVLVVVTCFQIPAAFWTYGDWQADRTAGELTPQSEQSALRDGGARMAMFSPWRMEPMLVRAWLAEHDGEPDEAARIVQDLVHRHPNDASALRQSALVLLRIRHFDDARSLLASATERAPVDYRTWAARSWLAGVQGRHSEALDAWQEATRHWPVGIGSSPIAHGLRLQPMGLLWLAVLEDAHPKWSEELGYRLMDAGDYQTAILAFEQSDRLYPTGRDTPHLGRALVMVGRVDEGMAYLDALAIKHPTRPNMPQNKAHALEYLGEIEKAANQWVRAAELGMGEDAYRRCYELLDRMELEPGSKEERRVGEQKARCRAMCEACR